MISAITVSTTAVPTVTAISMVRLFASRADSFDVALTGRGASAPLGA